MAIYYFLSDLLYHLPSPLRCDRREYQAGTLDLHLQQGIIINAQLIEDSLLDNQGITVALLIQLFQAHSTSSFLTASHTSIIP